MHRCLFIFLFSFITSFSFSQTESYNHDFKLSEGKILGIKHKYINGVKFPISYEKQLKKKEGQDSVVYMEFYKMNKHWDVYRYVMRDKKPQLSGWQKEFNEKGELIAERYCLEGDRRCKLYRTFSYYPDGTLMSDAAYYGNKREGNHYYYYTNGQLRESLEFQKNKLQNVLAYYDQDGNPLDVGTFCDGNGLVNIYSMNGIIIQIKSFSKGKVKRVLSFSS